jgi:hypothetical protein
MSPTLCNTLTGQHIKGEEKKQLIIYVLFIFQPVYIPVCRLHKYVDLSQIPEELGGSWSYNHNQWLQNRIVRGIFLIWCRLQLFI